MVRPRSTKDRRIKRVVYKKKLRGGSPTKRARNQGYSPRSASSSPVSPPVRSPVRSPAKIPRNASPSSLKQPTIFYKTAVARTFVAANIPVPKYTYPFDRKKADAFLRIAETALAIPHRKYGMVPVPYRNLEYYKQLLKKTKHVSWDTFVHNLVIAVRQFSSEVSGDFALFIPDTDITSNYWISQIVYHLLPRKPTIIATHKRELTQNIPILLCDDGVYSSLQMSDILIKLMHKNMNDQNIHLITPYITEFGIKNLMLVCKLMSDDTESQKTLYIHYTVLMKPVIDPIDVQADSVCYADGKEKNVYMEGDWSPLYALRHRPYINRLYLEGAYCSKSSKTGLPFFRAIRQIPIYFDHKLPDSVSSFPGMYSYNVIIAKYIRRGLISETTPNSGMITGCAPAKNDTSKCPPPPYKNKTAGSTLMLTPSEFVKKYGGY